MQLALSLLEVVVLGAGLAQAERRPLLLAVEVAPEVAPGAAEIRRAIAEELAAPIAAPGEDVGAAGTDVLIVSVDRRQIAMSLRSSADSVATRTIPLPAAPPDRLRALAWLAGNLARDQVAPFVAGEAPPSPSADVRPRPASIGPRGPVVAREQPAATLTTASRSETGKRNGWAIVGAAGLAAPFDRDYRVSRVGDYADAWQVEAQRRSGGVLFGVALDGGPRELRSVGAAVFAGFVWERRGWRLDLTLGGGVEYIRNLPIHTQTETTGSTLVVGVTPEAYGRGSIAFGYALTNSVDVVLRTGLHASIAGLGFSFVNSTLGVRVHIP